MTTMAAKEHLTSEARKKASLSPASTEKASEAKEILLLPAPVKKKAETERVQPLSSSSASAPAARTPLQPLLSPESSPAKPINRTGEIQGKKKPSSLGLEKGGQKNARFSVQTSKASVLTKHAFIKAEVVRLQASSSADEKTDSKPMEIMANPVGAKSDPNAGRNSSSQVLKEGRQEDATPLEIVVNAPPAKPRAPEKTAEKPNESKLADAIGLAVAGPFYSAAKELGSLKDDPLAKKLFGILKKKGNKNQDDAGPESSKSEIAQTVLNRGDDGLVKGQISIKADEVSVEAEKATLEYPNSRNGIKSGAGSEDEDSSLVEVERRERGDRKQSRKQKRGKDIRRSRRRGRGKGSRRLGGALKKTKIGRGLSAGVDMVKSVGSKIGGLASESPIGKIGGALGKTGPLKMLGKAGRFMGRIAGKAALPLALATTAFDAVDGWNNAAEITGKDEKDLTFWDKIKASGAKAAEGFSFGLIPAETFFDRPKEEQSQKPVEVQKSTSGKTGALKTLDKAAPPLALTTTAEEQSQKPVEVQKSASGKSDPWKMMSKAAPPLALATTAFDAVDGWNSAAEITGKDEKDLTFWDKIKASGAKAAEGLSFGLVPVETFFDRPKKKRSQKLDEAQKSASVVVSGPEDRKPPAPKFASLAAPPSIAAKTGVAKNLPSPLKGQGSSFSGTVGKPAGEPATNQNGTHFQGGKATLQKLDVIIGELRNLQKEMKRGDSGDPSPLRDPFLRETIAETERRFNTW